MSKKNLYTNISVKRLPKSEVEITGELSPEALSPFYEQALKSLRDKTELPGFRKGHVPEKVLKERIGELSILEDAAELALQAAYPEIIEEQKLQPISYPRIALTSIALGAAVKFTATVAVFPEFKLPDYRSIGKETKKPEVPAVADADVEEAIERARKEHRHREFHETHKDAGHDGPDHPDTEEKLGELTDAEAKELGKFSSVKELREKVREMLQAEHERSTLERGRIALLDALVAKTEMELPEIAISSELERMEREFEGDIARLGMKLPEYLKRTGKTKEAMIAEWRPRAQNRAKLELILGKIAEAEKLTPSEQDISSEIAHLKEHHKDADEAALRSYVTRLLTHQKVLEFLEKSEK